MSEQPGQDFSLQALQCLRGSQSFNIKHDPGRLLDPLHSLPSRSSLEDSLVLRSISNLRNGRCNKLKQAECKASAVINFFMNSWTSSGHIQCSSKSPIWQPGSKVRMSRRKARPCLLEASRPSGSAAPQSLLAADATQPSRELHRTMRIRLSAKLVSRPRPCLKSCSVRCCASM